MGSGPMANQNRRGRKGGRQNESPGGPKDGGTESERGAERRMRGCAGADRSWLGMTRVLESGAEDMLM